jgi:Protein of unknown function DUF262/Protein of unknown function (DUF1524)
MSNKGLGINANDIGLGATLNQNLLMVPPNQRSYAWEIPHVQTLLEDLSGTISAGGGPYFLGTVVLTQGATDRLEVADGQQRLATTSILIAAIRDKLEEMGDAEKKAAALFTTEYLLIYDVMTGENTPRLKLNYEDNDFFLNQILISATEAARSKEVPTVPSHLRIANAAALAKQHVEKIISQFKPADKPKELYKWVKFLREGAMVIAIRVPDHINAYTMFETLNDRGLRASQTDILKNFLFGKAQDRLHEVQMKWSSMVAAIETIGDEDLLLTYLRHHWTLTHGYTAERELAALVKNEVAGKQQSVTMATGLDELASDYTGLLNPLEYIGWPTVDKQTRAYIYTITKILAVEQVLPVLLAVLKKFEPVQAKAAMKMFLNWSVRFMVAGSGGGGPLDRAYGALAKEVIDGTIKTATQLRDKVRPGVLRTDAEFKQTFSKARVTKNTLARYYLRALELHKEGEANADLGGTLDETFAFNVEHVMPQRESPDWPIEEQLAQQFRKRLGNMVLLSPDENVKLGNKGFVEKRIVYAKSPLLLTQTVGAFANWGPTEIDQWQESLAELAVKIWPEK